MNTRPVRKRWLEAPHAFGSMSMTACGLRAARTMPSATATLMPRCTPRMPALKGRAETTESGWRAASTAAPPAVGETFAGGYRDGEADAEAGDDGLPTAALAPDGEGVARA